MDLGIRGKKAIINGGSAGMGKGSAIALAREGVDLVISSRGKDRLENTCEEIRKETGVKVIGVATDHSTDEGREKIINACPDPDILIRTGGHKRLSNFMLWQLAYSEIYFLDKLWPDFTRDDFKKCLDAFKKTDRRFGKRIEDKHAIKSIYRIILNISHFSCTLFAEHMAFYFFNFPCLYNCFL